VGILLAAAVLTRDQAREREHRLDVTGAVLVTLSIASLTYGVTQTQTRGWTSPVTVVALAIGIVALAAFVVVEARFARAPLIPLRLFGVCAIAYGNVVMLLAGACFMTMWYFLSLSMQNVLHYGALQTGVGFLPHTVVTIVVGARLTPWIMQYVDGRTLIIIGAVVAGIGFGWQSRLTPDSGYLSGILGPAIVISVGGGLLNTTKQVGGALGLAVLVTVAGNHLHTPATLAAGYGRAFLTIAAILVVVATVALALPAAEPAEAQSAR